MALRGRAFLFLGRGKKEGAREGRRAITGDLAAGDRQAGGKAELAAGAAEAEAERKTLALPAILSPVQFPGGTCPSRRREPAPVCGDAGGAAGDQRDQGPHRGDGLAGAGAARSAAGGCGSRGTESCAALRRDAGRAESGGQLSHPDRAGDRGRADGRLRGDRDGADRRSGAAGDAVAGGWRVDPHQCAVGRAAKRRRAMRRRCRDNWSRARWNCATTS